MMGMPDDDNTQHMLPEVEREAMVVMVSKGKARF